MSRFLTIVPAVALALGLSAAAHANFIINTSDTSLPGDASYQPVDLTGQSGATPFSTANYAVSFSVPTGQGVVMGSSAGNYAAPITGNGTAYTGNYFSTGTGSITITFTSPQTTLALLWGSVDTSNSITFEDALGNSLGTVYGSTIDANANGFQGFGGSFYTEITSNTAFDTVVLSSGVTSFELAQLEASPLSILPEPASLAMLGAGILAMVCAMAARRAGKFS